MLKNRSPDERDQLRSAGRRRGAIVAFGTVLLLCLAWVTVHTTLVDAETVRLCDQADAGIAPALRLPVFLSEIALDGYVWNRHAEHLGRAEGWRLRHTDFDNAPQGREVHWNSAFAWYLRGLGEWRRAQTGDSLRNSIFRMSIWANPILLALILVGMAVLFARRFGLLHGAIAAIGMVVVPAFYEGFQPAYPDHHGLIACALLGTMAGVAFAGAGWVRADVSGAGPWPRSVRQARRGMIFSAWCGAAGLWFSALSVSMLLGAVGLAAVVSALVFARRSSSRQETGTYHPEIWRTWASWGAGASLFFYLLEYFPSHLGLRLEVNHPFYALAWLGGGWIVARMAEWAAQPIRSLRSFPWQDLAWPAAAVATLPLLIVLGPPEIYLPKDPFIWRLHQHIVEFLPLLKRLAIGSITWNGLMLWLQAVPLIAVLLLGMRRVARETRAVLLTLLLPLLLLALLQFYQSRWGLLLGPLYVVLAAMALPELWRLAAPRRLTRLAAATGLLVLLLALASPLFKTCILQPWHAWRRGANADLSPGQALALLHRQIAYTLREQAGGQPVVLLSSPNSSCLLAALGGFKTVGTLYWENAEGLKTAAAALNAQSEEEAQAILRRHQITHVALITWENFIAPYFQVLHPDPAPGVSLEKSFGRKALYDKVIPPWMRPIIFVPNPLSKGLGQQVLLLQFAPEQTLEEARFHVARFVRFVDGNPSAARDMLQSLLAESPTNVQVRVEIAGIALDLHDYARGVEDLTEVALGLEPQARDALAAQAIGRLFREAQWQSLADFLRNLAKRPNATPFMLRQAAWMLATLPESRDLAFATACSDRLDVLGQDHLAQLARAAVRAAGGEYDAAIRLTRQIEASPSALATERELAAAMRARFEFGQPWVVEIK